MTNYTKITDFAVKDTLLTGDPSKVVRGTEIDDELVAIQAADATNAKKTSGTGSIVVPTGTEAQRDAVPLRGYLRYSTTRQRFEGYSGTVPGWAELGGEAASGGGGDRVFYENDITVTADYTITTGKNAMTAGPITINSGVTITVPSGSTWSIV